MKLRLLQLILLAFIVPAVVLAQPGNPGSGPIGGLIYLLLAGIGVGYFTLRKKRR